jgi:hypothetical protein
LFGALALLGALAACSSSSQAAPRSNADRAAADKQMLIAGGATTNAADCLFSIVGAEPNALVDLNVVKYRRMVACFDSPSAAGKWMQTYQQYMATHSKQFDNGPIVTLADAQRLCTTLHTRRYPKQHVNVRSFGADGSALCAVDVGASWRCTETGNGVSGASWGKVQSYVDVTSDGSARVLQTTTMPPCDGHLVVTPPTN